MSEPLVGHIVVVARIWLPGDKVPAGWTFLAEYEHDADAERQLSDYGAEVRDDQIVATMVAQTLRNAEIEHETE